MRVVMNHPMMMMMMMMMMMNRININNTKEMLLKRTEIKGLMLQSLCLW